MSKNKTKRSGKMNAQQQQGKQPNGKGNVKVNPSKYFFGKQFSPVLLAQDILDNYLTIFVDNNRIYQYSNGVYRSDGEERFGRAATYLLGIQYKSYYVSESMNWVKSQRSIKDRSKINPADGLINVKNGLLDWRSGTLIPHSPDRLSTIQIPVNYDPNANDETVLNFIENVIPADTIDTIFELIGYCMTTHTRYEKAFLFKGTGGNGKSTFINMLIAFLGKENVSNVSLQDLENHRFKLAMVLDKLVNTFSDLPRHGLSNANNFKSIVSGDPITAEEKNKTPFDMRPFCKLVFSTNEIPRSADTTDGFFRRWIIIPFDKKFTPDNADTNLIDKLTTPEAQSTLLNYAIEGLRRLGENGRFTESETTRNELLKYRKETDHVMTFVDESCELDQDKSCKVTELYTTYKQWSKESGLLPLGKIKFNQRIVEKYNLSKTRTRGVSCDSWQGIALRHNDPFSNCDSVQ